MKKNGQTLFFHIVDHTFGKKTDMSAYFVNIFLFKFISRTIIHIFISQ